MSERWRKTTKDEPCPICKKYGWCRVAPDGGMCWCGHVSIGAIRPQKNGYLHSLNGNGGGTVYTSDYVGKAHRKAPTNGKAIATLDESIRIAARSTGGKLNKCWAYPRGGYWVARFDLTDGKEYRPIYHDVTGYHFGDPNGPLPLYYVGDLANAPRVYLVEGEKCVDAAASIGLVAVTSPHGASCASNADWSAIAGKEIIALPDHDDVGEAFCRAVGAITAKLDPPTKFKILRLPGLTAPGADLHDWLEDRDAMEPDALRASVEEMADGARLIDSSDFAGGAKLTCVADLEEKPRCYIWRNRIPRGKISLTAGDPGVGKSVLSCEITARATTGSTWPDGADGCDPMDVILVTAEDDPQDTIKPRLRAAGANLSRVHILECIMRPGDDGKQIERPFTLENVTILAETLRRRPEVGLIIIDPVSAFMPGQDSHNNTEVRALLAPLSKLAGEHNVGLMLITHLNKSGTGRAMYRSMGSLAFVAAARIASLVIRDKANPKRRLFLPLKNNVGDDQNGLAYTLIDREGEPVVVWEKDAVTIGADDALSSMEEDSSRPGPSPEARNAAGDWLRELLADGPLAVKKIEQEAKAAGMSMSGAVRRAREMLAIRPYKGQFGDGWYWKLPDVPQSAATEDVHEDVQSTPSHTSCSSRTPSDEPAHLRISREREREKFESREGEEPKVSKVSKINERESIPAEAGF